MTEVSYRSKLIQRALLVSHDADKLWKVFEDAMEHIIYVEAQRASREIEVKKLKAQNERQTAMIDNLEKTLWKKK